MKLSLSLSRSSHSIFLHTRSQLSMMLHKNSVDSGRVRHHQHREQQLLQLFQLQQCKHLLTLGASPMPFLNPKPSNPHPRLRAPGWLYYCTLTRNKDAETKPRALTPNFGMLLDVL